MTITQLTRKCKEFALKNWNMEFNLPVEISTKMFKKLGYYQYRKDVNVGIKMVFAQLLFSGYYKEETIDSVIHHELTHWALHIMEKPFKDKHPVFEAELRRVGGSSTKTIKIAGKLHNIVCCRCGETIAFTTETGARNMLKRIDKDVTICCRARYKHAGIVEVEDTYELRR
jgi:hypothetical protein